MEREGKEWPQRHYNPAPKPPWPSLREGQTAAAREPDEARAVNQNEMSATQLAERVQRIVDDPARAAQERDPRVLLELERRLEQEQAARQTPADDDRRAANRSSEESARTTADTPAARYNRWTGEPVDDEPSRPAERSRSGGRGLSKSG